MMFLRTIQGTLIWTLYPLYLSFFILALSFILNKKTKKFFYLGSAFLILISIILTLLFPVMKMPKPSGDFEIGTLSIELIDNERKEIYSDKKGLPRRIKVQVWYPAMDIENHELTPWIEDGKLVTRAISKNMGFPYFLLDHTSYIMSNSYYNPEVSDKMKNYPVIIISHGWMGSRTLHADTAELLASNGFIVLGIDHTYGSQVVVFEGNEIEPIDPNALPGFREIEGFLDYGNDLINTFKGDINLVMNSIHDKENWKFGENLNGKMDLSKIGLIGHSSGGGASVLYSVEDERIKCLFGMDPWTEPLNQDIIEKGLNASAIFLRSAHWEEHPNNPSLFRLIENSKDIKGLYQIEGTTHADFTMAYMYSRLTGVFHITGKQDRSTYSDIQNKFILSFFENILKNQATDFDNIHMQYNQVTRWK